MFCGLGGGVGGGCFLVYVGVVAAGCGVYVSAVGWLVCGCVRWLSCVRVPFGVGLSYFVPSRCASWPFGVRSLTRVGLRTGDDEMVTHMPER